MKYAITEPEFVRAARQTRPGRGIVVEILIFIAVFIVGSLIQAPVSAVAAVAISASGGMSGDASMLVALFSTAVMTAVVMLFCRVCQKRRMSTLGFTGRRWLREYLAGLVIGAVMLALAVAISLVTGAAKWMGTPEDVRIGVIALYFVGFLLQGASEEVLCRGYFMVSAARKNSLALAVGSSSVIFGLLHMFNSGISLIAVINLVLFGIFMGIYMLRRGDIWGVCAIHSAWNFAQGNIFGISVSGTGSLATVFSVELREGLEIINGGTFGLEGGLGVTLVLCAAIAVTAVYKNRGEKRENEL